MADPRVPPITSREQLQPDDRHHFDAIAESRGSVRGPFRVLLHRPSLGGRVADLGAVVRFDGDLDAATRELAILATAYEWDAAYVWAAHEPLAIEAGLDAGAIDAVSGERAVEGLADADAAVVRYVRALVRDHDVPDETFDAVRESLGTGGVVELTATIGYYGLTSAVCNAFRVLPDGG